MASVVFSLQNNDIFSYYFMLLCFCFKRIIQVFLSLRLILIEKQNKRITLFSYIFLYQSSTGLKALLKYYFISVKYSIISE